jgi:hypothetical protein
MKSYLIEFINKNPSNWKELLEEKQVVVKNCGDLYIFNYSILADFTDPYVREARGIIIDLKNMKVVCWPFTKFCNYGEKGADNIDWSTARVQEKVDGSIMKVWYYNDKWNVSTNGVIDAAAAECTPSASYYDVFTEAAANVGLDYSLLDKDNTYIFELVSKYNRVVIDYNTEPTLYHIGTRNNITGEESVCDIGVKHPKEYPLTSLEDCIAAAAALNKGSDSVQQEGFVVVDAQYRRIKIKSPEYVAIHRILPNGEITDEKIIEYSNAGIIDDIVAYIPSIADRVNKLHKKILKTYINILNYCSYNKQEVEFKELSRADWAKQHNKDLFFKFGVKYIFDGVEPVAFYSLSPKKMLDIVNKNFDKLTKIKNFVKIYS